VRSFDEVRDPVTVDWSSLEHSYGPATDTPGHLWALEHGDAEGREAAVRHLWGAILHQGAVLSAGPPAIRAVTTLLDEGRAHPDTVEEIVDFLGNVAVSMDTWIEQGSQARMLPLVVDAVAAAYPVVRMLLERSTPDKALFYAETLGEIALMPPLADRRGEVIGQAHAAMARSTGPRYKWVVYLDELGADVRGFLEDPDPATRVRAALVHQDEPRSQQLILAALDGPPLPGVPPILLIDAALRITPTFEAIALAACRFVRQDDMRGRLIGWGAVVRFAFAEPYSSCRPLTSSQRALLEALVANDHLWSPGMPDVQQIFKDAGLPHDRDACRTLLQGPSTT
jgi:hypothetical protein